MKLLPRTPADWLLLSFSALEALALCLAARHVAITFGSDTARFSTTFYIVFASALLALGFVSVRLRSIAPKRSLVGRLTVILLLIGWMSWAAQPEYLG